MTYDFDTVIDRWNTRSVKWDGMAGRFGTTDALPMWVADMDFPSPPEVVQAIEERARHGIFGYTTRPDAYYEAIVGWMQARHGFPVRQDWILCSPHNPVGRGWVRADQHCLSQSAAHAMALAIGKGRRGNNELSRHQAKS